ncbi:hypothetical protein WS58_23405 [Burkholderia pseudomultivorans]|uniref:APC family permease n=1 Tax=Burkholderia pseudomultivorans TaxID=1207504 RepID=UPI0001FD8EBC|nr:APC family permease [Burkholderia pseudomultivorans]EGD00284.1 amino acid permease-associated region [Burkholderia sp. TJI49]AOI90670.1 hypothetical protein WS57_17645 [Burkholderia pseudomultivorans]KVC25043.1 hypothetical protein WS56_29060 [Burkholderia pseudomultivorans]KVC34861.1 hypothetical protein WS55_32850 [Burkholderia pseudomultivorans]KVC38246.1 hypothetical protein WS58_23405 [Burkholderia pseudomultivorans]
MTSDGQEKTSLRKNALGWISIVFLVIATNGPLTALVGGAPLAIGLGNGAGAAGTYVVIGVLYLIFSVGFCAMSRHIRNAGAFYAYIAHGLGRPFGIGGAFLAILAYNAMLIACYAMIGFFLGYGIHAHFGIDVPWWVCALGAMTVVFYFGYKNIEFSGRVLFALMLAEVLIILLLDASIIGKSGAAALSVAPFLPEHVFAHGFGPSIVFVVGSYMGFETTAIYAEEARDPSRSIPRATYAAVTIILVLYAASVWLVTNAYGIPQAIAEATKNPGDMWFVITERYLGNSAADATNILMITSLMAALISFHNTSSRYLFSLGRERIVWARFAELHPVQQTPLFAGVAQIVIGVAIIAAAGIGGADAMLVVVPLASVPAAIGIVAVQAMTALAVIGFFVRDHRGISVWRRVVAPALSALGLFVCLYHVIRNVSLITGSTTWLSEALPWITLAVGGLGAMFACWLKNARPQLYSGLGRVLDEA